MNWLRVTRKEPCPLCEKPSWCCRTDDGQLVLCMRVESNRPGRSGGWLHRIGDQKQAWAPPPPRPKPLLSVSLDNAEALMDNWRHKTDPARISAHASQLGVSTASLTALGAAWAHSYSAWAFPMRDGAGRTVGIRLRAEDGRKWAVRGSREGLFYPERVPSDHVAVVCEGPTDTAAAITMGLWAVGRPSCAGGVDQFRAMCQRLLITHVVVVGDNDRPKQRPDGSMYSPGLDGAETLIRSCGLPAKLVMLGAKDFREWWRLGKDLPDFVSLSKSVNWRFP